MITEDFRFLLVVIGLATVTITIGCMFGWLWAAAVLGALLVFVGVAA